MNYRVKVWDLPTRLFHWSLVILFGVMWWSAESGQLQWHIRSGVTLLVLALFRLLWGVLGSQTSRFGSFVRGPAAIRAYLRGEHDGLGHNPLGALMVLAMLAALLLQLGLGLFAADVDSYTFDGPLAKLLDGGLAEQVTEWHGLWFNVLLGLVGVHVTAIIVYRVLHRENLVKPMLVGHKKVATPVAEPRFASSWFAVLLLFAVAGLVLGGLSWV
ncbi:cytochrome b/b6 domain-containing protein [Vogesella oryzae]|uniref:cytochrome b/b6 domain-containing protein n=1 Tax=Vogesella oryzae TaxID=1735285 RepID=UPI00158333BD|nr:cytochrome b/b6 domain-containing protein [Vogesella oryzae]